MGATLPAWSPLPGGLCDSGQRVRLTRPRALLPLLGAPALAQKKCLAVELLYEDNEEPAEKRTDSDGDAGPTRS